MEVCEIFHYGNIRSTTLKSLRSLEKGRRKFSRHLLRRGQVFDAGEGLLQWMR